MRNCAWKILRGASDASTESVTVGLLSPKDECDDKKTSTRQKTFCHPQPGPIHPPEFSNRPLCKPNRRLIYQPPPRPLAGPAASSAGETLDQQACEGLPQEIFGGRQREFPAPLPAIISSVAARGKFITFEGLDGSGKSTQLEKLARSLRAHGLSVTVTREPGGTVTGEKIREVLLHSATAGLFPMAEMALMFASRAQHIHEVILPALAEGRVVLCDRFTDSTEAYQGGGRKLGSKAALELHEILCGDLQPDLTILLDNDVAFSVERARRRNLKKRAGRSEKEKDENRFEQENRGFFGRVRHAYR